MKQETLEEAALRLYPYVNDDTRLLFINGAKFQAERSYNEQEVNELVYTIIGQYANRVNIMIDGDIINSLFKQFKK